MSKGAGPIPTQPGGQERQTVPAEAAAWHPPQKSGFERAVEGVGKAVRRHGPKVALSIGLTRIAFGAGEVNTVPDFQAAVAIADRGRAPITREIKGKHGGNHDSGVTTKTSGDDGKGTPGFSPTDGKGRGPLMTVWSSRNPGQDSAVSATFRSGREQRGKEAITNGQSQRGNQTADRFFRPPSHSVQEVLNRGNDHGDTAEAFLRGLFFGRFLTGCAAQAPTTLVYETVQSERPSPLPTATLTLDQGNSDQAHLVSFETDKVLQNKVIRFQEATRELLYRQFGDKSYTKWEITYTVDDASYNNLVRDQFPSFFVTNLATGERYVPAFWGEPGNIGFVAVPQRAQWIRVTSAQDDSSFLGPHEPTMVYMDDMDVLNGRPIPRVYNRDIGAYLDFNLIPDFSAQDEERFVQTFVDAFNANRSALRNIAEEQHGLDAKDNPQKIVAFSPVYRPDGSVRFLLEDQTRGGRQDFIIRSDGKKVYVPETPEDDKSPESNKKQWRRVLDPVNGVYSYEKQVWNGDEYTWEVVAIFAEDSGPMGEIINLNLLRQAQPEGIVSTTTPVLTRPSDQQVTPNPESPTPDLKSPTPQPPTQELSPTPDPPTPQVDTPVPPSPTEDVPVEPTAMVEVTLQPTAVPTAAIEPTRKPESNQRTSVLRVEGTDFVDAKGNPVVLRGAALPHYNWNNISWASFNQFRRDAKTLQSWGANFAVVPFNSAFLGDPAYRESLVSGLEYLKKLGYYIELTENHRGMEADGITPHMIATVDDRLGQDWVKLLQDPEIARRVSISVDIVNPLSEPWYTADGNTEINWGQWKDEGQLLCEKIRAMMEKQIPCALSGVHKGGNLTEVGGNRPTLVEIPIEAHVYQGLGDWAYSARPLNGYGLLWFAGEVGYSDDIGFIRTQLQWFKENRISFAMWAMQGSGDGYNLIDDQGRITERGRLLQEFLK